MIKRKNVNSSVCAMSKPGSISAVCGPDLYLILMRIQKRNLQCWKHAGGRGAGTAAVGSAKNNYSIILS
jgi:hypothetical protein